MFPHKNPFTPSEYLATSSNPQGSNLTPSTTSTQAASLERSAYALQAFYDAPQENSFQNLFINNQEFRQHSNPEPLALAPGAPKRSGSEEALNQYLASISTAAAQNDTAQTRAKRTWQEAFIPQGAAPSSLAPETSQSRQNFVDRINPPMGIEHWIGQDTDMARHLQIRGGEIEIITGYKTTIKRSQNSSKSAEHKSR